MGFRQNYAIKADSIIKMQAVYWSQFGLTTLLCCFMIFYYADSKGALYAKILVFISFLSSLICFAILPIDIYESSEEQSEHLQKVQTAWRAIYYINFFLCWFVLPFAQQYQDSGQFSFAKKIKESFVVNGIMIGILCIGAFLVVIYIVVAGKFTISQLPSIFATLVNIFGLTLVSVLMGYGLISFPKQCYLRRDYKRLVSHCHRQAEAIKSQQQNVQQEIQAIRLALDGDSRLPQQKRVVKVLIDEYFKSRNYVVQDDQLRDRISKKSTADLHKLTKKRILQKLAFQSQLDELVDDLKDTTQSYLSNNYFRKRIYYTIMFAASAFISVLIFFAELATFASFLAPANVLALVSFGGTPGLAINTCLTAYIAYIMTHTICRIKVYKVFELHRGHSSASSLLFTAINLSRVCYPLCYNYLQITGLPNSSFLQFFGQVNITAEVTIVFPILMLTFAVFNLFDIYTKIMGYLGFSSYAFDAEQAEEKRQQGRTILVQRLKQRNIQNNHLEMIHLL